MTQELKKIKKIYGEEMMHMCRELFPSILTNEGELLDILIHHLAPTHSFALDIKENGLENKFKDWIHSFVNEKNESLIIVDKNPFELLDEKGYTLYECRKEEDIQAFRKYYRDNELICTIKNGGRLERCFVFFAVRKNVDEIKREMFFSPKRDDYYGTSVMSIQFTRGENNTISIKNRYNHIVPDADSTLDNNLEKLASGLTKSFERFYNLNINGIYKNQYCFLISNLKYIMGNDGRFYRYNVNIDGNYYCENNIVINDGKVDFKYAKNKERYLLIDEYLLDLKEKSITSLAYNNDSFVKSINDVGKIKNIEIIKDSDNKIICLTFTSDEKVYIEVNKYHQIVKYYNDYVRIIDSHFLENNKILQKISLNRVLRIKDEFLSNNVSLEEISLPSVLEIGDRFLFSNNSISSLELPNVNFIKNYFLFQNKALKSIDLPNVLMIGDSFINNNRNINKINFPKVKKIGKWFLSKNECLNEISMPNVLYIDSYFIPSNRIIEEVNLPKIMEIGDSFLRHNYLLTKIDFANIKKIGDDFLYNNCRVNSVSLPELEDVGNCFMHSNTYLNDIDLPNVKQVGSNFLLCNNTIKARLYFNCGIHCLTNEELAKKVKTYCFTRR